MNIEDLLSGSGVIEDVIEYRQLSQAWNRLVGEHLSSAVSKNCKLVGTRNKELVIACANSLVCTEVRFRSTFLLQEMKKYGLSTEVNKIAFAPSGLWDEMKQAESPAKRKVLPTFKYPKGNT